MKLTVVVPSRIVLDGEPSKRIVAEGQHGSFGLLPRHVDYLASLVPGILTREDADGNEHYLAVNGGTLVKHGPEVMVATRRAIPADDLGDLRRKVREEFRELDEREQRAHAAMANLEVNFVQKILEVEKGA